MEPGKTAIFCYVIFSCLTNHLPRCWFRVKDSTVCQMVPDQYFNTFLHSFYNRLNSSTPLLETPSIPPSFSTTKFLCLHTYLISFKKLDIKMAGEPLHTSSRAKQFIIHTHNHLNHSLENVNFSFFLKFDSFPDTSILFHSDGNNLNKAIT